jgi:hypothetical protein
VGCRDLLGQLAQVGCQGLLVLKEAQGLAEILAFLVRKDLQARWLDGLVS